MPYSGLPRHTWAVFQDRGTGEFAVLPNSEIAGDIRSDNRKALHFSNSLEKRVAGLMS